MSAHNVARRWIYRSAGLDECPYTKIASTKTDRLLSLFHHIHHEGDTHEVHHCGGKHKGKDVDYTIEHCSCGKHSIDKEEAIGHGTETGDDLLAVRVRFTQECPDGGWHIESGEILD